MRRERPRKYHEQRTLAAVVKDYFFFQAEDGIRDYTVTGVQTCALPISLSRDGRLLAVPINPNYKFVVYDLKEKTKHDFGPPVGRPMVVGWTQKDNGGKQETGISSEGDRSELQYTCKFLFRLAVVININ